MVLLHLTIEIAVFAYREREHAQKLAQKTAKYKMFNNSFHNNIILYVGFGLVCPDFSCEFAPHGL